jgi:hypothetical protein
MDKRTIWQKIGHEFVELLNSSLFIAPLYLSFTAYRRLVTGEAGTAAVEYGMALVSSLILAKIVLIGEIVGLGKRFEKDPLIVPTVVKALLFTVLQLAFNLVEHTVRGLLHHEGFLRALRSAVTAERRELLTRAAIFFFAFIPFFALRELRRVLGEAHFRHLFGRKRTAHDDPRLGDSGRS